MCALTGRFDDCVAQADALWNRWQRAGSPPIEWMASAMSAVAMVHGLRNDGLFSTWEARALRVARSDDLAGAPWLIAPQLFAQARVAIHLGTFGDAADVVRRAFGELGEYWWAPYARAAAAELAVVADLPEATALLEAAAPLGAENDWAAACLRRAEARRTGDLSVLAGAAAEFERVGAHFEWACTLALIPDRAAEARAELAALHAPLP